MRYNTLEQYYQNYRCIEINPESEYLRYVDNIITTIL